MSKGNTILLAALGGAAVAAIIANFLSTEKGKEFLNSASETIKDLSGKATEYARNNIGEVIRGTTDNLGNVVKETIANQVRK